MRTHIGGDLVDVLHRTGSRFRRPKPQLSWQWRQENGSKTRYQVCPYIEGTSSEMVKREREREHLDYLQRMATEGVIPIDLAIRAKVLWWMAKIVTAGALPVPAAAAFSCGPVEYHWTAGPHQLSAEIPSDGPSHWTYRNSTTGKLWGREIEDITFPEQLIRYLAHIAESSR